MARTGKKQKKENSMPGIFAGFLSFVPGVNFFALIIMAFYYGGFWTFLLGMACGYAYLFVPDMRLEIWFAIIFYYWIIYKKLKRKHDIEEEKRRQAAAKRKQVAAKRKQEATKRKKESSAKSSTTDKNRTAQQTNEVQQNKTIPVAEKKVKKIISEPISVNISDPQDVCKEEYISDPVNVN